MIFSLLLLVPLVFCILLGCVSYPSEENKFLADNAVAELLGVNITTQKVLLAGFSTGVIYQNLFLNFKNFVGLARQNKKLLHANLVYHCLCNNLCVWVENA